MTWVYWIVGFSAGLFAAIGTFIAACFINDRRVMQKHDPTTCEKCMFGDDRQEWFR